MNIIKRIDHKIRRTVKVATSPKRFCIICNNKFRGKFEPLNSYFFEKIKKSGYPYELDDGETLNYEEYSCPKCGSMDRDRLYALYFSNHILTKKKYKLLDIAPSLPLMKYLKEKSNIEYRSADLFMENVDDKVNLMDMNIYPDNSFDIFICSHVLEHVPDDIRAMKELKRVLRPGGFGIAMVPIILPLEDIDEDSSIVDPNERWRRFGQDDHLRLYSKSGFVRRLSGAGFNIEEVTKTNYSEKKFIQMGINPKSVLYIVS